MMERGQPEYDGRSAELGSPNTPVQWLGYYHLGQTHQTSTDLPFCIYKMGIILLNHYIVLRIKQDNESIWSL